MNATADKYTVKLTPAERVEMARVFEDWQAYYLNWDGETDERMADECHSHDCTPTEFREQIALAKTSSMSADSVTLVAGSDLETDVKDTLEGEIDGFKAHLTGPARCRTIKRLLKKLDEAE